MAGRFAIGITGDAASKRMGLRLEKAARAWAINERQIADLVKRMPDLPFMTIYYEDLCHEPHATLRRVTDFIGIEPPATRTQTQTSYSAKTSS